MSEINIDLPPLEDRPLVTFALFAYNQEKYIREAVEGAFAQTYEPLEIILSDDCSMDRTFEIMEEMAVGYKGPHKVLLNRTTCNDGTLAHVMSAIAHGQGDLIVMAAGDDISVPSRTKNLVAKWNNGEFWGIYSNYDVINDAGKVQGRNSVMSDGWWLKTLKSYFLQGDQVKLVHGATSAYDRRIFDYLDGCAVEGILTEDGVFSFLLNLYDKPIGYIGKSLVLYRSHSSALSNAVKGIGSFHSIKEQEMRACKMACSFLRFNALLLPLIESSGDVGKKKVNFSTIDYASRFFGMQASWADRSLLGRVRYLLQSRSPVKFKWMSARLLGLDFFVFIKLVYVRVFRGGFI